MKRIIPVAAIAAGALFLGACGSSSSSGSSGTSTTSTSASSSTSGPSASSSTSASSSSAGSSGVSSNPTNGAKVTLNESGSTLLYPYLQTVAGPLHTAYPDLTLNPGPGGSGKGLSDVAAGTTNIGGSDAYLSPTDAQEYPTLINVPIVVSSQAVNYNLKGITNLKLNGPILAEIYEGTITNWNDPAIAKLNPGVTLPSETIHPIHREESSGDTFLFTSFLSDTSSSWASKTGGPSELPTWPSVSGAAAAEGNPGMVQACSQTPGCVAYIGISAEKSALTAGLGEAMLQNKDGNYEQSSPTTVDAAVAATSDIPADMAVSLIDASGSDSYPIVNFEYILTKKAQSSTTTAEAIKAFLLWAISTTGGSSAPYLAANQFEPLPSSVIPDVKTLITSIG